jgi:hypothetical protein
VAEVETKSKTGTGFSASSWNWSEKLSGDLPDNLMPLVPFEALDGRGEAEPHLKLLRRINFIILQQLTIATLQAFKQRGIKGVPTKDDKGNLIDYNDIFSADPGALWLLPATADMWESGQVDLSGVLLASKDSTRQLSAVTRTPMYMFDAGGENQSAEGAALADAGLVFKVRDRNSRDEHGWSLVVTTAYRWLGRSVEDVSVIWADPKMIGLAEQASALSQFAAAGVPFRTRLIRVGFDPAEVDQAQIEREDDLIFSARVATMKAALSPQPEPAQPQGAPQQPQEPDAPTGDQQA